MASRLQQIFIQDEPEMALIQSEIQYLHPKDNENEYLSQFINFQAQENLQYNSNPISQASNATQNQPIATRSALSQQNMQNQARKKTREKSYFHNFQKHLVITLRNVIKLGQNMQKTQTQQVALQMWEVFIKSHLYSKKFLYVLFGVFGSNDQNQFSKKFLNELGYMEIFAKYPQDQVRQAQRHLRRQVIAQFLDINLKGYLNYRKLKRVDEFQKYMEQFLEELKQGSVRKRLPKHKKINMLNLHKQNLASPDTSG